MKKIIALCCLLLLALPVFAADWQEINYKTYVDLDTKIRYGLNVSAWLKELNPGNWELRKGKKVWYRIVKTHVQCGNRKMAASDIIYYDLKGNVIDNVYISEVYMEYFEIVPDTVGEAKYYALCSMERY